ncbi:DNA-binding protein WhiA [Tepidimicrobium xylanilyticum]|uniref:DNA-binding protein WhiA n=1 Tax=Tepidimicrobium xylanilyticum TaxID=1123352 RepID=UPI00265023FA|nr:DNA-binding protein WhiA [Tepidimicrobium xylanilyticum]GMG96803.1 putative sporulation transcription regulator WhiA [Tepidimicrobium xylanilyticum]
MSFSSSTKNELSRLPIENRIYAVAELAAIIKMNGAVHINGRNISLRFETENAAIARRIFSLIKILYNANVEVMVRKNKQLKKNNSYLIIVDNESLAIKILKNVGILTNKKDNPYIINYKTPAELIEDRNCKRAYIRGAFLGGGSVNNPEKAYHLEFVTNSMEHAKDLSNIINSFNLDSKIVARKGNYVVYLKEGQQIVDILNIMGAHQALLKFEDIRVFKDVRNNVNRLVNCETANLGKTIEASLRQVESIEFIDRTIGIEKLPSSLQEIARLRLQYKEASLKELGAMLNPPVGKSGVNHRLRKIDEIAEELRRKENLT